MNNKKPFNACVKSLNELQRVKPGKVDIHKMLVASLTLHKTIDRYKSNSKRRIK